MSEEKILSVEEAAVLESVGLGDHVEARVTYYYVGPPSKKPARKKKTRKYNPENPPGTVYEYRATAVPVRDVVSSVHTLLGRGAIAVSNHVPSSWTSRDQIIDVISSMGKMKISQAENIMHSLRSKGLLERRVAK